MSAATDGDCSDPNDPDVAYVERLQRALILPLADDIEHLLSHAQPCCEGGDGESEFGPALGGAYMVRQWLTDARSQVDNSSTVGLGLPREGTLTKGVTTSPGPAADTKSGRSGHFCDDCREWEGERICPNLPTDDSGSSVPSEDAQ